MKPHTEADLPPSTRDGIDASAAGEVGRGDTRSFVKRPRSAARIKEGQHHSEQAGV